jgi:hypothetical protein
LELLDPQSRPTAADPTSVKVRTMKSLRLIEFEAMVCSFVEKIADGERP